MQVTVVALDFPALIERLMHRQDYEACLLGYENVEPDPNRNVECVAQLLTQITRGIRRKKPQPPRGKQRSIAP